MHKISFEDSYWWMDEPSLISLVMEFDDILRWNKFFEEMYLGWFCTLSVIFGHNNNNNLQFIIILKRNKPTQLTDHAFSDTNGMVWFLTSNKYKVPTKKFSPEWPREGGKNTPSNEQFHSSTLKNGFTAGTLLRLLNVQSRVEVLKANRTLEKLITSVLFPYRLYTDAWLVENSVLWKSTTSQKYSSTNNLAIAPLFLGFHFQLQGT